MVGLTKMPPRTAFSAAKLNGSLYVSGVWSGFLRYSIDSYLPARKVLLGAAGAESLRRDSTVRPPACRLNCDGNILSESRFGQLRIFWNRNGHHEGMLVGI